MERLYRLAGFKIKAGVGFACLRNGHASERGKQGVGTTGKCSLRDELFGDGNGLLIICTDRIVFEHGELWVMAAAKLFSIAKATGKLEDAPFDLCDNLLHMYFGRRNKVQLPLFEEFTAIHSSEILNGRFGNQVRRKDRGKDFQIPMAQQPLAHVVHEGAACLYNFNIHAATIAETPLFCKGKIMWTELCYLYILWQMDTLCYDTDDIIYALATPWGTSALAIVRVSGAGCIDRLCTIFSRPEALRNSPTHMLVHGELRDPLSRQPLDEVLIAVFRNAHGYTAEESAEISCHGSMCGIELILGALKTIGMRPASPGEFTFRAFIHGRLDLTQAEAVQEIVTSSCRAAHAHSLGRLKGNLFFRIEELKKQLIDVLAGVEVQLDYAEEEIGEHIQFPIEAVEQVKKEIDELLKTYRLGRLYAQGARVVIAGSTNTGKSTLFNMFLKEERAIVSDVHGTTRDFIEAQTVLADIPIRLYDTAGLRQVDDEVEQEGMRRTKVLIEHADIILLVLDGNERLGDYADIAADARCIVVWNKTDLTTQNPAPGSFPLSAKRGEGFAPLCDEIAKRLRKGVEGIEEQQLVLESARQYDQLKHASEALEAAVTAIRTESGLDMAAMELQEALHALGLLTGEVVTDEILEHMFSTFCVGK